MIAVRHQEAVDDRRFGIQRAQAQDSSAVSASVAEIDFGIAHVVEWGQLLERSAGPQRAARTAEKARGGKYVQRLIVDKLHEIEAEENVRILLAVESGSRAWGFASPDSDYDVRFLYVRRAEDYLRLDAVRDVIEWPIDDELDINGWDLQKALRLLYKSNPTLFE